MSLPGAQCNVNMAFYSWQDKMERVAALAKDQRPTLATPLIGEVLAVGAPRVNVQWWKGFKWQPLAWRMLDLHA